MHCVLRLVSPSLFSAQVAPPSVVRQTPVPVATQAVCGAAASVAMPLTSSAKKPVPGPVQVLPPLSDRSTPSRVVPASTMPRALSSASARTLA